MTGQNGKLTPGQRRALAAMPENVDSVFPKVRATIPASSYTDPARFDAERERVFKTIPLIAGPSALLSRAGSYVRRELLGMPLLLTRSKEGELRAFVNVCRHRGSKLCSSDQAVDGSRIVCPYHAWTYRLDGALFGIPRQETFPGIDKADFGLKQLPAVEAGGLIWVGIDPARRVDFATARGEIEEDLNALGLGDMCIFDRTNFEIRANWKLVMDSMLDSYHVTRLHKDSLARFFVDVQNIIDSIGPHIRAAAARGNFTRSSPCETFADARKVMVFAYTLFPNGIIVVSPEFVSVGIVRPIATDRTDVEYFMLIDRPPPDEKVADRMRRSFDLMKLAFGREDYWAAEQCDSGLRSGAMENMELGGMEIQITMFHEVLNKCLANGSSSMTQRSALSAVGGTQHATSVDR
jgi:phenylpropionate dioxygenase-like ring-hydroxylating dioxygenase large terminal subunit